MNQKKPTFKEALNASLLWCNAWDAGEISDEVFADRVSELLETKDGTRGFLAVSLSSESPLMDRLPESLVFQLRAAGEIVIDLTVRNLAMSTAMSLHHQREKSLQQKAGSEQVRRRCLDLLRCLEPNKVKRRLEKLLNGTKGEGADVEFLEKWGYDNEQKQSIASSIYEVAENQN